MSPGLRRLLCSPKALDLLKATTGVNPLKALLFGTSSAAVTRHAYLRAKGRTHQTMPSLDSWRTDPLWLTEGALLPHRVLMEAAPSRSSPYTGRVTHTPHPLDAASPLHCGAQVMLSSSDEPPPPAEPSSDVQRPKPQSEDKPKQPSDEQLKAVSDQLSADLPQFFKKSMNYSIMAPDIIFENRIHNLTSKGITQYQLLHSLFKVMAHVRFAYLQMDLLSVTVRREEASVVVHWRIKGESFLPSLTKIWKRSDDVSKSMKDTSTWYEGLSTYHVACDGKVSYHVLDNKTPTNTSDGDSLISKLTDRVVAKSGGLAIMSEVVQDASCF